MKILIISRTPWNNSNSFGNTFTNLFDGMEGVELYNICCQAGNLNSDIIKTAVQFTDNSVLKSIFSYKIDSCVFMQQMDSCVEKKINARHIPRNTLTYLVRDIIWKFGKWKSSKTLKQFLTDINPDIIYLPIYTSWYMCDIQTWFIKLLNKPVVGHISDDVYSYQKGTTFFENLYRKHLRPKIKRVIARCEYLEVFAENMRNEYEKIFNKSCYLIGKGVDVGKIDLEPISYNKSNNKIFKFIYTGNIGNERYKSLCYIARAIEECDTNVSVILEIYSATPLTNKMKKEFAKYSCLKFKGEISYSDVVIKQKEADILVHVEGFSKKVIAQTRMSFSTKIIDYMLAKKPIFAVGSDEINSIQLLKNNNMAIVAENIDSIALKVKQILKNEIDLASYINNALSFLKAERNIKNIQTGILNRFKEIYSNESCSN